MTISDRERAAGSLRRAIQLAAREAFGAGMVERPIPGLSTVHRDVEPLAGVRAAVLARDVAAGRVRRYALAARADGCSWDDIAVALGVEQVEGSVSGGGRAYLHVVADRRLHTGGPDCSWGRSALVAHWRCSSGDRYVADHGPFTAASAVNELGRARSGARHAAEIVAYQGWTEQ